MSKMSINMIRFMILSVLACFVAGEELYSDKYDYIDVGAILNNKRILNQYFECFIDKGPCITPDAKFLKEKFPEAIVTKCRKCTDKQKESFEKIVVHYTEKEPENWTIILNKAISDASKRKL